MKILLICLLVAAYHLGFSQTNDLKGPKAKNAKAWKQKKNTQIITFKKEQLKGPKAKNTPIQKRNLVKANSVKSKPSKLKGPKAKNKRF